MFIRGFFRPIRTGPFVGAWGALNPVPLRTPGSLKASGCSSLPCTRTDPAFPGCIGESEKYDGSLMVESVQVSVAEARWASARQMASTPGCSRRFSTVTA